MSEPAPQSAPRSGPGRKLALVAALMALTAGLSGYFMGLRQSERSADTLLEARHVGFAAPAEVEPEPGLPEAPRYREMATRAHQPNHGWHSQLETLPKAPARSATELDATAQAAWKAQREARRAYDGAPPTVPHPIDQHSPAACLACHGQPTRIGQINVPQISHPPYSQCIQCHAPAGGPASSATPPPGPQANPSVVNAFVGQRAPTAGSRAYTGAPPIIPHTTWMRQNCMACHGDGGSSALKTSHPERQNCMQCHAAGDGRNP